MGKMQCPNCLGDAPSAAKACRHCGYAFSAEQLGGQAAFEQRINKAKPFAMALLLATVLGVGTCAYREATRPSTPAEIAANAQHEQSSAQFLARGSAGAIVKERMKNPAAFDLVEADANPAKMDDGQPGWIVAVTYRGTNSFGAVTTERALVWVDQTGNTPLKVVDVPGGSDEPE